MKAIDIETTKKFDPKCYAYITPGVTYHEGWTKIGYTTQDDVHVRILQQTRTAGLRYELKWKEEARFADTGEEFIDKDFHAYLQKKGIEKEEGLEWFRISPEASRQDFTDFRKNHGILKTLGVIPYTLRAEQEKAVRLTETYFKAQARRRPEFLWNAKPRFGKTLTAYDLCMRMAAKKVLIVTNRPAIAASWYDDYVRFLGTDSGYYFVSETPELKGKPYAVARHMLPPSARKYIEFVSLQDLKGSLHFGGAYDKLREVENLEWDVLIVDEAHEGVDTYRTDVAFDQIKRKCTLHLSGTPFRALATQKFEESAIYNWTYADEQKAKTEWNGEKGEENPYAPLPQLHLYTYQLSEIVRDKLRQGADFNDDGDNEAYAFDLNEFFATNGDGGFKYDGDVDKFLEALTQLPKFPFSTPELRDELKHTFWLLNRVDSARALAKKLQNHPVFKQYEIILAAGDGKIDDADETGKSLRRVKDAIAEHDKTITLSVGQLTTGVTIPEWTAVLMLSNIHSPALYMQAAFRAQNPCTFRAGSDLLQKVNAYVFDFDPARTLDIFEQFANNLTSDTAGGRGDLETRKAHIRELLNFFPVYGEDDEGEMVGLDAGAVLSVPRRIHAREVVRRGFMCNFLFQNISNIFSAPKQVVEIINSFQAVKEKMPEPDGDARDRLALNEEGEVDVPQEIIIGTEQEIFGDKVYGELQTTRLPKEIFPGSTEKQDKTLEKLKNTVFNQAVAPRMEEAKEHYGADMRRGLQQQLTGKLERVVEAEVGKCYHRHRIEQNKIEAAREKEIEQACRDGREEDIRDINNQYERRKQENEQEFRDKLPVLAETIAEKTQEEIVRAVETDKREREKAGIEGDVRDHLRGFTRTIPSFLMAYGDDATTLENFDTIIPDRVFREVTGITLDAFRFLRDGGDYEENGETKHFEGQLFNPVVFNDSIKEFLALKNKLSNYFDETQTEDIFDYIPPQKTNQIFTPKKVVKEMVDMLEQESPGCFDDPDKTFIDLYMKSGLYVAEIVKRLYRSEALKNRYPIPRHRLQHIFEHQVYGLAPTEIIYRIATSFVLGFDKGIHIERHLLRQFDAVPSVQEGTLANELEALYG